MWAIALQDKFSDILVLYLLVVISDVVNVFFCHTLLYLLLLSICTHNIPFFPAVFLPSSRCQSSNGASESRIIGGGGWLNLETHLSMPVHNWDVFFSEQVMSVERDEWDLSHSHRHRFSLCFLCALFPALLRDLCHFLSAGKKKTKWEINEDGACHRERAG